MLNISCYHHHHEDVGKILLQQQRKGFIKRLWVGKKHERKVML